jgi:hypothetical protein
MSFLRALLITVIVSLTALLNPTSAHAAQSYDNCTGFITSLPATITTQGTWCLNADLTTAITSGVAINVAANNVTIDCNDFKLGGLAAGAGTQTNGIYANTRDNLTIRRCNIRGFYGAVYIYNGTGHLVEDNRFDGNTGSGVDVEGTSSIIRRNLIIATGGSSLDNSNFGIYTRGSVDVLDNTISGVAASGTNNSVFGIIAITNPGGSISGNRVRGVIKTGAGIAYGITSGIGSDSAGTHRITVRNNDVVGDDSTGSVGVSCATAQGRATGNVIGGFATAINTCSGTNNEIVP